VKEESIQTMTGSADHPRDDPDTESGNTTLAAATDNTT